MKKRPNLTEFIREHRTEIDRAIARALDRDENPYKNDQERRQWILNDPGLYYWAKSEGVRI